MPQTPYLVSGTIYTSRGTVSNSIVIINSDAKAVTDSKGKYVIDLANLIGGYTADASYTISSYDEFDNEYKSDTITVTGENQTKNLYLGSRDENTDQTRNSETRRVEIRSIGNKPITEDNMLPVQNLERPLTQKLAYVSGTSQTEYVGLTSPGTLTSEAKWRIKKLFYDGTKVIDIKWASGNAEFDKIWTSRTSYNYS